MSIDGKGLIWRSVVVEGDDVLFAGDKAGGFPVVQQGSCLSVDDLFHRLNVPLWYVILGLVVFH